MGEHKYYRLLHEGGEAQGGAKVIGEDEEGRDEGPQAPVEGDAVGDRGHPELANAEVYISPAAAGGPVYSPFGEGRDVGAGEVGRTADEIGPRLGDGREALARGVAGRHLLALGEGGQVEGFAAPAGEVVLELGGEGRLLGLPRRILRFPCRVRFGELDPAFFVEFVGGGVHPELLAGRRADGCLGFRDLFLPEGRAVDGGGALLGGGALADHALQDYQAGAIGIGLGLGDEALQTREVVHSPRSTCQPYAS